MLVGFLSSILYSRNYIYLNKQAIKISILQGLAYIEYENESDASQALIKTDQLEVDGFQIKVGHRWFCLNLSHHHVYLKTIVNTCLFILFTDSGCHQ